MFAAPDRAGEQRSRTFAVQMHLAQVSESKRGHSIDKGMVKERS